MLAEDDAGDFRIVARREEDEPAVIAQVALGAAGRLLAALQRNHLRRAGLARTSLPGMRARPPVPAPLTTRNRPSCSAATVSGFSCTCDFGARRLHRLPSVPVVDRLQQVGHQRVPPFATVDIMTASETGVIET